MKTFDQFLNEAGSAWSGVVITEGEGKLTKIFARYQSQEMSGWTHQKYHMTIAMGPLPKELKDQEGETIELTVNAVGWNDKALAVRVSGPTTQSIERKVAHITLGYPPRGGKGGWYADDITNWQSIADFKVKGKLQEGGL